VEIVENTTNVDFFRRISIASCGKVKIGSPLALGFPHLDRGFRQFSHRFSTKKAQFSTDLAGEIRKIY
jgi:hypothetical protein